MNNPSLGFIRVKVIALGVQDAPRARRFYAQTLGLAPASEGETTMDYQVGDTVLMLKDDGTLSPVGANCRVTLQVVSARRTEALLRERGVTISDPVTLYDGHPVGAFLDSEGNKLWFCSEDNPG